MRRPLFKPSDFSCKLNECPPGFFLFGEMIGFKNQYGDPACCDTGEYFWGGTETSKERDNLIVTPLWYEWEEE